MHGKEVASGDSEQPYAVNPAVGSGNLIAAAVLQIRRHLGGRPWTGGIR